MKVAIIGFSNLKYSPYIKTYTNLLEKKSITYDLIIPNRDRLCEKCNGNLIAIKWNRKKNKMQNFIFFAKETRKILKKEKYDFVFVLTTLPAILLADILTRNYKKKYLVDIRDYTYDKLIIFRHIEKFVLKNAYIRVISSPAFKDFLPNLEYTLCHNLSYDTSKAVKDFNKHTNPIKIGYVGSIGYLEECKRLINLVKNDDRFCFYFYGNESNKKGCGISDYVAQCQTDRIKYLGEYEPHQKKEIISHVDILFNDYGNDSFLVRCALSNKLYDSFFFKKPLITSPMTIMSKIADKYSFNIDSNTKNLEELYKWYTGLEESEMITYMDTCLKKFEDENSLFQNKIFEIIENNIM